MKKLTFQEKYDAIGRKDSFYEGIFVTAVKTTGIFCRPACRARKPKPENVVFYGTAQEALQNGYRPRKVCRPMEKLDETPEYVKDIIKELHQNPYLRIKDYDLRQRGIEPNQIRRWFRKFLTKKRVHANNKPPRLETRKQLERWHQLTDLIELALLSLATELSVPMEV